jgi:hypothetical protein
MNRRTFNFQAGATLVAATAASSRRARAQTDDQAQRRRVPPPGQQLTPALTPDVKDGFGTFARPFAADSLWNSRPIDAVLGDYKLPKTRYHPFVGPGPYSTGIFRAQISDGPITIHGLSNDLGVLSADDGDFRLVRLPHWPASVVAASGSDGHADVVDLSSGIIHSFWQLRKNGPRWQAEQYAWSALNGRGFGDPAHNHQGARAAGVATLAGMIRKHEIDDAQSFYAHALALSLDGSALRSGYVFPATAQDNNAPTHYRGEIAMGSLLMLPADFDLASLASPILRKVAQTLMRFGARVVDQNEHTRFAIYVENGASFDLHQRRWNLAAAADLDHIADALRPVVKADTWLDGNGQRFAPEMKLNLLSLRGPWVGHQGKQAPQYDSWSQSLRFGSDTGHTLATQRDDGAQRVTTWAPWREGKNYRFSVDASSGASLRLKLRDVQGTVVWDSGDLQELAQKLFVMPAAGLRPLLIAASTKGAASIRASLIEQ